MTNLTTTQLARVFTVNKRTIQRWLSNPDPPNHCWQKRGAHTHRWSTVECVAVWLGSRPGNYINPYLTAAQKWNIHTIISQHKRRDG